MLDAVMSEKVWTCLTRELGEQGALRFVPILWKVSEVYDSYGVPADLLRVRLRAEGFEVSEGLFNRALQIAIRQRQGKQRVNVNL